MVIPDYDAQDAYNLGYNAGKRDAALRADTYDRLASTNPHYVYGYNDGYNGVEPQQFMEEGPTEDTQESEFDAIANAMTECTSDDLSRIAYWALDLLVQTEGVTRVAAAHIAQAKLCVELVQEELNLREEY